MQQDGRRASSIGAGEPPPDYGSRGVHPRAQRKRAEEDEQSPVHRRRVEEAEAVACSERGTARHKIEEPQELLKAADVPRCCEHRRSCGV